MSSKETSFSFHCMICYEGFENSSTRYPVVLPCGHTYVCNACGERLERCMECRTPLFMTFNPAEDSQPGGTTTVPDYSPEARSSWARPRSTVTAGRTTTHHNIGSSPTPPARLIKKRLPLPKNVVLLSLIEATELASADVHQQIGLKNDDSIDEAPLTPQPRPDHKAIIQSMHSLDEEDRVEEEKIHLATSLSVGVGGTYAVAAKEGLTIFMKRPIKRAIMDNHSSGGSGCGAENDVDNLVDDFHRDHMESQGSMLLDYGDRLQIVAVDKEGWAKLARGYGYVRADHHQIVKVGGAVDRACRLEAMLRIVSQERKRLRKEQTKIDNSFIRLTTELQHSLEKDEDLTVICRSTFSELDTSNNGFEAAKALVEEKKESRVAMANASPSDSSDDTFSFYPPKPDRNGEVETVKGPSFICFSPEEFLQPTMSESFSMTEVTASARQLLRGVGGARDEPPPNPVPREYSMAYPSPREMRAGARAWRERNGRDASNGIDFQTGMSGHSGVSNKKNPNPHEHPEPVEPVRQKVNFRMSSHTGLSAVRKRAPTPTGSTASSSSGWWLGMPKSPSSVPPHTP